MKTKNKQKTKGNLGQVTVEYILLAVVLITLFQVATNALKERDYLKNFREKPQAYLKSIIQNGIWNSDPHIKYHPSHHKSHYTPDGKGCDRSATNCLKAD